MASLFSRGAPTKSSIFPTLRDELNMMGEAAHIGAANGAIDRPDDARPVGTQGRRQRIPLVAQFVGNLVDELARLFADANIALLVINTRDTVRSGYTGGRGNVGNANTVLKAHNADP